MDQFRRHDSLRHTTTTRYRVTYKTPFGCPPVSDSASPTSGRGSPDGDYHSNGSGYDTRGYDYPPASASTNCTPDRQPHPSDRDAPKSDVEQATSEPEMPLEAVKLFLVVMCEGTERHHDEFKIRGAAKNLAQDLESNFGVRLSADRLLGKYKLLRQNEIRQARPGPKEHDLIMALHRRWVTQLEEKREREGERWREKERERQEERRREKEREREEERRREQERGREEERRREKERGREEERRREKERGREEERRREKEREGGRRRDGERKRERRRW